MYLVGFVIQFITMHGQYDIKNRERNVYYHDNIKVVLFIMAQNANTN